MNGIKNNKPTAAKQAFLSTGLLAMGLFLPVMSGAQSTAPLSPESRLVGVTGAPAPTEETFTVAAAQDLVVTFTDFQTPAALASASVVVTQGASIVGMTTLAPPASTATLALSGAIGEYTLRVIGAPNSSYSVGTFGVCTAPKTTPTNCIQSASLSGNIASQSTAADPTISTVTMPLTVITGGTYTVTFADAQFPAALATAPSLAIFQGSTQIAIGIQSGATVSLSPGNYSLFAIAQADAVTTAGLYGINISSPGVAPLLDSAFPVGTLGPATTVLNPTAQSLTLKVTDFAFPGALASAGALVTAGAASIGSATAGNPATFAAAVSSLQVWHFGVAGSTAGTYEVDLGAGSSPLTQTAFGLPGAGTLAYAFVTSTSLAAGPYTVTANDFQFPGALQALKVAVAQNGVILANESAAGSVAFTTTSAGPVILLIDATPPASGSGLVDVNVQNSTQQILFDQVQGVSSTDVFTSQVLNLPASGNFDVTLTDLQFPAQFQNLALVISSGGAVVGKIFGGGTFSIAGAPGAYLLNFVATPASAQAYGLFGLQVVNSAPTVTLTSSAASVVAGAMTTLTWSSTNATSCTASGGTFTGTQATSGSTSVTVAATTTYTLTCSGSGGGSGAQSVSVTATSPPAKSSGGGGGLDAAILGLLALAAAVRARQPIARLIGLFEVTPRHV